MHKWVLAVVEFAKIYKEEHPEEEEIMVSVHDTESVYSVLSETLSGVARADIT